MRQWATGPGQYEKGWEVGVQRSQSERGCVRTRGYRAVGRMGHMTVILYSQHYGIPNHCGIIPLGMSVMELVELIEVGIPTVNVSVRWAADCTDR